MLDLNYLRELDHIGPMLLQAQLLKATQYLIKVCEAESDTQR